MYEPSETEYVRAERVGMVLDSILCPECPDPGMCGAERECAQADRIDPGLWLDPDAVELAA